mmetsp:Transcript_2580/g.7158  ORF Transcript_2580/g.7158 Transcript_2580/m.7158 type:complete len:200 (+) Transcript_2580:2158-2757(+)
MHLQLRQARRRPLSLRQVSRLFGKWNTQEPMQRLHIPRTCCEQSPERLGDHKWHQHLQKNRVSWPMLVKEVQLQKSPATEEADHDATPFVWGGNSPPEPRNSSPQILTQGHGLPRQSKAAGHPDKMTTPRIWRPWKTPANSTKTQQWERRGGVLDTGFEREDSNKEAKALRLRIWFRTGLVGAVDKHPPSPARLRAGFE